MLKRIFIAFLACLIFIQFFRPERNNTDDNSHALQTTYNVPANINLILQQACADCHSNKTHYPWYANLQPIGWWMSHHVVEGKEHLNLSEFTKQTTAQQLFKLDEIAESVEDRFMPLSSYTMFGMHPKAQLTDAQRKELAAWARQLMDSLQNTHPTHSLRNN